MTKELSTAYLYQNDDTISFPKLEFINDRRSTIRETINELCFLVINIKGRKIAAKVIDISERGAKIETSCFDLPKHFILDNSINNQRVICEKVWSKYGMSGVKFIRKKHN